MAWLREHGYTVDKVEHRHPVTKLLSDFCGFADILAFDGDHQGVLAVQATTKDHRSDRVNKIMMEPRAAIWCRAGNRIRVMAWSQISEGARTRWVVEWTEVIPVLAS